MKEDFNEFLDACYYDNILEFCDNNLNVIILYVVLSYIIYAPIMKDFVESENRRRHDKDGNEINIEKWKTDDGSCSGYNYHTRDYERVIRESRHKLYASPLCLPVHVLIETIKYLCSIVKKLANMMLGVEK